MFGFDLPAGLQRLVASYIDTVTWGLRSLRRGGDYANAPAAIALAMLRDFARLLRVTLLILACQLDLKPAPHRAPHAKRTRAWRPPRAAFRLFPRYTVRDAEAPKRPPPASFLSGLRDPLLCALRQLDTLSRVLANPHPAIRRMARRLPRQLMVMGPPPPKRPPSPARREAHEALICARLEAWHHLREFRRRRRDMENLPASAA